MTKQRRPMRFSDEHGDPSPTVVTSEWSAEEIAERYVAQQRARMMARAAAKAQGQGSGDQAATPTRHADADDDNQAPQRRKPGV